MTDPVEAPIEREEEPSPFDRSAIHALLGMARQYKRQFIVVSIFSFLYTGLDLLQPWFTARPSMR